MKILCVHHKGGVGKTTAAIHVTGVLIGRGERVLLIDADSQADSYRFFSEGSMPPEGEDRLETQEEMLTVVSKQFSFGETRGRARQRATGLSRLVREREHEHVVVDIATDLPHIAEVLFEVQPDLVLIGVKRDDVGSFVHLNDMLTAVEQAAPTLGEMPAVKVVPIGVEPDTYEAYVESNHEDYEALAAVDWRPDEAGNAVYVDYQYVWEYPGCSHLFDYYRNLLPV